MTSEDFLRRGTDERDWCGARERVQSEGAVERASEQSVIVTVRMPFELAEWLRDDMGKRTDREAGWVYQRVLVALVDARGLKEGR